MTGSETLVGNTGRWLHRHTGVVLESETTGTVRVRTEGRADTLVLVRPVTGSGPARYWEVWITTTAGDLVRTPPLPDPLVLDLVRAWSAPSAGSAETFTAIGDLLGKVYKGHRTLAQHTFGRDRLLHGRVHTPVLSAQGCYNVAGAVEPYPGHWPVQLIFDATEGRLDGVWPYMV